MAPPCFADIGKDGKDVLSKGYPLGAWNFQAKGSKCMGMKLTGSSTHNTDNGNILGNLEAEYKCDGHGLKFVEKWSSHNVFTSEMSVEDKGLKGLKLSLLGRFNPSSGNKSLMAKSSYKNDNVNTNLDLDCMAGPNITSACVAEYQGCRLGYLVNFDAAKSKLSGPSLACEFAGTDFTLSCKVNDMADFSGGVHQKVSDKLDIASTMSFNSEGNTAMTLGAKYALCDNHSLKAKLSHNGQLGLSLEKKMGDGFKMTAATLFDTKNFSSGKHRVGLSVDYE